MLVPFSLNTLDSWHPHSFLSFLFPKSKTTKGSLISITASAYTVGMSKSYPSLDSTSQREKMLHSKLERERYSVSHQSGVGNRRAFMAWREMETERVRKSFKFRECEMVSRYKWFQRDHITVKIPFFWSSLIHKFNSLFLWSNFTMIILYYDHANSNY